MKKVVLAYSGGLDTSVILKWLEVEKNYDVIAVCVDVGQKDNYEDVAKKALQVGAKKVYIVDAKEAFVENYVFKGLKAGAVYESKYLLGTAYARPLIAKQLVEIAKKEGAVAISHGATGKGNDQVRFEAGIMALAPKIKVIAPWREWDLKSREDCIAYAKKYNIPLTVTKKNIYSRDENLYHISHEGGELEYPDQEHQEGVYKWVSPMSKTPDIPENITIDFEGGIPVSVNGEKMDPVQLLGHLNKLGSTHKVGVIDIVENRLVGMKSRGVYETPGGTILHEAHQALESLVLDRATLKMKKSLAINYADLVYDGLWFSPLKDALDAFVDTTQEVVTGQVVLTLFKGQVTAASMTSPYSLYDEEFVTFGEDNVYKQNHAEGFIQLFTLPLKMKHLKQEVKTTEDVCHMIVSEGTYESMAGTI
ncbi:argininosuccinate synthase [Acidaminobacter sp. JC074]|nr:argininosuccinate synthase [Acidaminobacter sp. JC074]MCH4886606.1 argininosuccinate synthase [Acidaminobacter sp. JC074]